MRSNGNPPINKSNAFPGFLFIKYFMSRYSRKEALSELNYLESLIIARVENFLKNEDSRAVAEILISIDNEIYQTEKEARRLRLMGRLDYEVYRTLMDGYAKLQKQIIELSKEYGLERDVKEVYSFLKLEASLANRRVKV
ncbi:MAG: hypothetical protein QXG39_09375 [Candidatus Aenigmatarchaeota archaeon]